MRNISFNKFYRTFNLVSLSLIIISLILLLFKGLNYVVDFKGGTLIEVRTSQNSSGISKIRDSLNQMNLGDVSVKSFGNVSWDLAYLFQRFCLINNPTNKEISSRMKIIEEYYPEAMRNIADRMRVISIYNIISAVD